MGKDLPQAAKAGADAIQSVETASVGAGEGLSSLAVGAGIAAIGIAAIIAGHGNGNPEDEADEGDQTPDATRLAHDR